MTEWPSTGSGMSLRVDLAKQLDGNERVDLGGGDRCVAEQFLDHSNVGAALQQVSRERMPERVRRHLAELGLLGRGPQDHPGALAGQPAAPGVEEDRVYAPA